MQPLTRADLLGLERYADERADFRARVIAHKKQRTVHLGEHLTFIFEDRLTTQYQIQEMLRIERIFEAEAIQDEIDTYNPMIPEGSNLKATMLIEYPDVEQRRRELMRLREIEHHIELQVGELPPVKAIADEDLPRSNDEKTAAVHFLRFELSAEMIVAWRDGATVALRSTLPAERLEGTLTADQRSTLGADFA
ncbi:MAG TPA: DUF3501 family protein [Rhodanobacteraceae bacterium]|nr:DUF3501 family protein [Rhodanobacteraceae bacterium]